MKSGKSFSLRQLLGDGLLINGLLTAIIYGSLYRNAEIWLQDYPPAIQERYGPKSAQAKRETILFAIPFFLILFGGVIRSNLALRRKNGDVLPFMTAFKNALGLLFFFWAYDIVIIDWLILMIVRPDFVILPGTEGMPEYDDHMYHLRTALPALPLLVPMSLVLALFTFRRPHR